MPTFLILESNSEATVARRRSAGLHKAAENFRPIIYSKIPDAEIRVFEPYAKPLSTSDLEEVHGVIITGSGDAWAADTPQAAPLQTAVETVFKAGISTLGICQGHQVAAVVLGGTVGACPEGMELGVARDVKTTDIGVKHRMMKGRSRPFCVPCMHRDEIIDLPREAILLASNDHCEVQAMAYQASGVDFWGVQYHPELPFRKIANAVKDTGGIFAHARHLYSDLKDADHSPESAARLGCSLEDAREDMRTLEISNWLSHVEDKPAPGAVRRQ